MWSDLPQQEDRGLMHTQRPVLEVLEQAAWACLTHRYFWTVTEPLATGFVPAVLFPQHGGVCTRPYCSNHWTLLAPPMTVFYVFTGRHLPISSQPQPSP